MVGGLVDQGAKCIDGQKGACSVGSFVKSGLIGGVVGAAGGALGSLGGKLVGQLAPKALDAVGGLFGRGASEAADSSATGAAESGLGAETREATQSAESGADNPGEAAKSADDGAAGESDGASCSTEPTHSFTGATPVLMADGATKAIDQIKVGDQIANSVPGQATTQSNTVTNVIVTKTDHDFVSLTIAPLTAAAATTTGAASTAAATDATSTAAQAAKGSVAGVLKKAAVGLAAALAVVAGTTTTHQTADGTITATATTAADTSHSTNASPGTTVTEHGGTLTTTFHHPFYDITQAAFVDAQYLKSGDQLQTPTGYALVTSVRLYHANTVTYDLTIGALHTYYVVAGDTPVLVHNCEVGYNSGGLSTKAYKHRLNTVGLKLRNVAVAQVEGRDDLVYGVSKGDDFHSEDDILSQLKPGEKIRALYSERQPCPTCDSKLAGVLTDDAEVTWSVPWSDPDTELGALINKQSNERLSGMIKKAMGIR